MIKILSERKYNKGISRQVVYEWEEDMSEQFMLSFKYMDPYKKHPIARVMRKFRIPRSILWDKTRDVYLFYAMNIDLLRLLAWYMCNVLPIVLDVTLEEIDELYKITKKLPIFWVTSIKIYEIMKKRYPDCNVKYIPLTASARYLMKELEKKFSFIQYGRRNPVLHEYALRYCDEHPGCSYIYRHDDPKQGMRLYKKYDEQDIGAVDKREEFIEYLLKSKISLCSSPLKDNTRDFGNGIDFLTPRWYESVVCRCHILARISDIAKKEAENIGLIELVDNIDTYKQFENLADRYLRYDALDHDKAYEFAEKNCVASRASILMQQLSQIGIW